MDLRKLKTLIDLVSESGISELEITEAEGKVRIVKAPQPTAATVVLPPPAPAADAAAIAAAPPAAGPAAPAAAAESPPELEAKVVKSPMVGTFYRSASPGSPPFVEVGSEVKPGDSVCIIEAMKIMNEVECDLAGRIAKVLVENGQAVEFGQPLFVVE